jgi:hypothetical protein
MNKIEYEEIKKTLAEVHATLARTDLTVKERQDFEHHAAALSGQLMSVWLPFSNVRRAIMLLLFLLGLRAFINYDGTCYFYWLLITLFSPRCVGEAMYRFGKIKGSFKKIIR